MGVLKENRLENHCPRACVDLVAMRKVCRPCQEGNPGCPACNLVTTPRNNATSYNFLVPVVAFNVCGCQCVGVVSYWSSDSSSCRCDLAARRCTSLGESARDTRHQMLNGFCTRSAAQQSIVFTSHFATNDTFSLFWCQLATTNFA
jgi:hypothetical protein